MPRTSITAYTANKLELKVMLKVVLKVVEVESKVVLKVIVVRALSTVIWE